MIPRRRLPLHWADFKEVLRTPFVSADAAAADIARFEQQFAEAMHVPYAFAVASGRGALCLILDGLGLKPGDEVIVPAYTLGELLPLLSERGLSLIPADIDPATLNITVDAVRAILTPRTRAILVVHLLGIPCDILELADVAAGVGAHLIEDCAHAPGATVDGQPVGSFGTAALFSLEANKALAAFGGGVLTTHDPALANSVRQQLALRPRREWPAIKKFLLKELEELLIRSPAYGLLARLLFSEKWAARFEHFYRKANQRVRQQSSIPLAFSGVQARWALRRLANLKERHQRLDALWQRIVTGLPENFVAPERNRHGHAVFYNGVVRYTGQTRLPDLRQCALDAGIDLGIAGEVMDDCAQLLGHTHCPGAAQAFAQAVLLPGWDGMRERQIQQLLQGLQRLARQCP